MSFQEPDVAPMKTYGCNLDGALSRKSSIIDVVAVGRLQLVVVGARRS